jgi:hypothetical protein
MPIFARSNNHHHQHTPRPCHTPRICKQTSEHPCAPEILPFRPRASNDVLQWRCRPWVKSLEERARERPELLRYVRVAPARRKGAANARAIRGAGQASPILLAFFQLARSLACTPAAQALQTRTAMLNALQTRHGSKVMQTDRQMAAGWAGSDQTTLAITMPPAPLFSLKPTDGRREALCASKPCKPFLRSLSLAPITTRIPPY